jgi:hypothetical protein
LATTKAEKTPDWTDRVDKATPLVRSVKRVRGSSYLSSNRESRSTAVFESCKHRFVFDWESSEMVCERGCGWSVPIFERKEMVYASAGARLSSPSVANNGLGTDIDQSIRELRHGTIDPETGARVYMLSGALRFLGGSHSGDEDLVVELSDRLHGKISDSNLAALAAIFRKALRQYEKEKRRKAEQLLDTFTGGNGHG